MPVKETRRKLHALRSKDYAKIDPVIGTLRIGKTTLAETLWPTLLAKCERELESDVIETPMLKVILETQKNRVVAVGWELCPSCGKRRGFVVIGFISDVV